MDGKYVASLPWGRLEIFTRKLQQSQSQSQPLILLHLSFTDVEPKVYAKVKPVPMTATDQRLSAAAQVGPFISHFDCLNPFGAFLWPNRR